MGLGLIPHCLPHSNKIAVEAQHGLMAQVLKDIIFSIRTDPPTSEDSGVTKPAEEVLDTAMSIG